ncbi:MAG: sulfate reduction electron transfer complex DsrMKJOP subunit DsrO [Nitrospirota bacterium]
MSMNRREFIKIAGFSSLLGIGGVTAATVVKSRVEASQISRNPEALVGKRWGMVVDMSKFKTEEDYQRCIDACHKAHNVPLMDNPKREVKWIWKETYEHAFPGNEDEYLSPEIKELPFLILCNHCDNPPCVRVCPTKATFKRESDGIVMMDMHRCIGCRFCMAACPFGARSFNFIDPRPFINKVGENYPNPEFPTRTKGVVEKCTFCYERLAKGQMPACVEASEGALIFGDLEDPTSEVRKVLTERYSFRRRPELGTGPSVYYVL